MTIYQLSMHGEAAHRVYGLSTALSPAARLDHSQIVYEELVIFGVVAAKMCVTVTIWAYAYDVAGAVRPAVGEAVDVVAFDIEAAIGTFKRSRTSAVFAMPIRASEDVISYVAAPSEDTALYGNTLGGWLRCLKSTAPKLVNVDVCIWQDGFYMFDTDLDITYAAQFENDSIAHFSPTIWRAFIMVALVDHFSIVAQSAGHRREQVNRFAILPRFDNGSVAGLHHHRSDLALTKILEHAIGSPSIGVAMLAPLLAADNEDNWDAGGRDDPAALLSTVDAMDISDAVVNLPNVKRHAALTQIVPALIGCSSFCNVKEAA